MMPVIAHSGRAAAAFPHTIYGYPPVEAFAGLGAAIGGAYANVGGIPYPACREGRSGVS